MGASGQLASVLLGDFSTLTHDPPPIIRPWNSLFEVGKVDRVAGITTLYASSGGGSLAISSTSANYTQAGECPAPTGCEVVLSKPTAGAGRRSLALRKLSWWNPLTWFGWSGVSNDCAPFIKCSNGDLEVGRRLEYTSCVCRFRWWDCGKGQSKPITSCQQPDGSRYNVVHEDCARWTMCS